MVEVFKSYYPFKSRWLSSSVTAILLILVKTSIMTADEIEFLSIEDGVYDNELRQSLFIARNVLGYESPLMSAVLKLIRWDLVLAQPVDFFEVKEMEILSILPREGLIVNKELMARCLDIHMFGLEKKDAQNMKVTVESYLDVFSATGEKRFFLRALEIGRPMKGLFKSRTEEFYESGNRMIRDYPHPFWQDRILKVLNSFCTLERVRGGFEQFFYDQFRNFMENENFDNARKTLMCQQTLKILTEEVYKISCSEVYLAEGDSYLAKDPAGVYIGLADIYEKGYRKLHSVAGCEDLRKSLVRKLENQQQARNKILAAVGVNIFPKIDYEKLKLKWAFLGVTDFEKAFQALLNLPVISTKEVFKQTEQEKMEGHHFNEMTNSVALSNRGASVGFLTGEQAIGHRIRMRLREQLLADIQALKYVMDLNGIRDVESIARLMPESSPFLPEERNRIFFKGLYAGFQHDFQTAAYILVPQFEYIFKHLARNNEITIVRYHDKQQFDNTMGGCLEKILPVLTEDTFLELQSFLTDTNQSNFRNELLHGIIEPGMSQHLGKYVWWLALKMVFRPMELLA